MSKHVHHWIIDENNHGVCKGRRCAEERDFTNAEPERKWNGPMPLRHEMMVDMRAREHQAKQLVRGY